MDEPEPAHPPLVSVIIPTYNYSSVLKYAIQSVLWQTFQDFELWVIGDACTDDSEAVVSAFADHRIHWVNLPENTGSQSTSNNTGLKLARGKYVAYLGHDDLWTPDHLERLVNALETSGADAAHSLVMIIWAEDSRHTLYGMSGSETYDPFIQVPPSSLMHLRTMIEDTGGWKDYRTLRIPPDVDFVSRAAHLGKRFISVMELTAFKFPSAVRKNVYRDKPSHEQAEYARRIQHERDFLYHELLAAIRDSAAVQSAFEVRYTPPSTVQPGELVEGWRVFRGLMPQNTLEAAPLLDEIVTLLTFNLREDITPEASRQFLHTHKKLPPNGILIGAGWHQLERDNLSVFRWVNTDAQLLLTELDRHPWWLTLEAWLGPSSDGQPITLGLIAPDGSIVGQSRLTGAEQVAFEFTPPTSGTLIYTLRVFGSPNKRITTDSRILNFGVRALQLKARRRKLLLKR